MTIHVTKTCLPDRETLNGYIDRIYQTNQLTNNGPLVRELKIELEKYLDVTNLVLVANGTLALQLAIKALDLKGDIITTPYTYVATSAAIVWQGCRPVFVDIDRSTFCINPDLIENAITPETSAILATHVYGYPCDVEKIEIIAAKHNLKVIYDAAHCFGVKFNGTSLLNHGDASILSFHATKLFHTAEGGAVVTNTPDYAQRISLMKKFGHLGEEEYYLVGINAKLSEFHAAVGLSLLPEIQRIIAIRKQFSQLYDDLLSGCNLTRAQKVEGHEYNYAYYPVVFESFEAMNRAKEALNRNDIFPRRYFYPSLNTLAYLVAAKSWPCPVSEMVALRVLALPLGHELTWEGIEKICSTIIRCC